MISTRKMDHGSVNLGNGIAMPLIGLGTYKLRQEENVRSCVSAALECGYRMFDTASVYKNETILGKVLKELLPKFGLDRKDIFVTTKLDPKDHGYEACCKAIETSLALLQTDYIDLFLIHWPGVAKTPVDSPRNKELRNESWKAIEEYYEKGICKSIGVSNYDIVHLEDLLVNHKIKPHVNQVECHPHFQQRELALFCARNGIHMQAYSSLGTTVVEGRKNPLLTDSNVNHIASERGKTPAQVLLRWAISKGLSVLPKSKNSIHIHENFDILNFKLTKKEVEDLDGVKITKKYAWDPSLVL